MRFQSETPVYKCLWRKTRPKISRSLKLNDNSCDVLKVFLSTCSLIINILLFLLI